MEFGVLLLVGAMFVTAVYPLLALGRIWLYSKQQVDALREIRRELDFIGQKLAQR